MAVGFAGKIISGQIVTGQLHKNRNVQHVKI